MKLSSVFVVRQPPVAAADHALRARRGVHRLPRPRDHRRRSPRAAVTVAVLAAAESRRLFGVDVAQQGIQPVWLRIENRSPGSLRLQVVSIDPQLFHAARGGGREPLLDRPPAVGVRRDGLAVLPAAARSCRSSWSRPGLPTAGWTELFRRQRLPARADRGPGETAEGFVFTTVDLGTKVVHVRLMPLAPLRQSIGRLLHPGRRRPTGRPPVDFVFTVPVPGIAADYLDRDFAALRPPGIGRALHRRRPRARSSKRCRPATTNAAGTGHRRSGQPRGDRRLRHAARGVRRPLGRERDDLAGDLLEDGEGVSARRRTTATRR